jgi:hypothetical protein
MLTSSFVAAHRARRGDCSGLSFVESAVVLVHLIEAPRPSIMDDRRSGCSAAEGVGRPPGPCIGCLPAGERHCR